MRPDNSTGRHGTTLLAAALLALAGSAAECHDGHDHADGFDIGMQSHRAYFMERCIEYPAAIALRIEFETEYPVDFNVHYHTETSTEFPVRLRVEERYSGDLALPHAGEFCFMWTNPEDRPQEFLVRFRTSTIAP